MGGQLEAATDPAGHLQEQLDGRGLRDRLQRGIGGQHQRWHVELELAIDMQWPPRGRYDPQPLSPRQQIPYRLVDADQLLEIVQHQQEVTLGQGVEDVRGELAPLGATPWRPLVPATGQPPL